jgi:hypothetical protein
MTTKVRLFLNVKDESTARALGVRRMRNVPKLGQLFDIAVDGRSLRARITSSSDAMEGAGGSFVPDVYAEEF